MKPLDIRRVKCYINQVNSLGSRRSAVQIRPSRPYYHQVEIKFKRVGMDMEKNNFPSDFSGLIYPPDSENGVAFLMGLLWDYFPYRFAIEKFELDPKIGKFNHAKWFDIKGKQYINGNWKNITIELKVKSSGFLRDIKDNSNIFVDYLICWEDECKSRFNNYVGEIIELRSIYNKLSEDKKKI